MTFDLLILKGIIVTVGFVFDIVRFDINCDRTFDNVACRNWRRNVSRNERMRWRCIDAIALATCLTSRFHSQQS